MSASYPTPQFTRPALAPGILGALALLAGVALVQSDTFTVIRYVASILALIVIVFAWNAKQWWWIIGLAPIVIAWNPVVPIEFPDDLWLGMQYVAALIFIAAGIRIKVRNPEDRNRR